MKAIIKRNLKNYLKNPIFWIGLIVVLISMYQTLAPYLSIHYVKSDETFRKVKMASDGDVMEGCIPATPDKERELWEKEIVKILQDTENGFGMSEVEAEAVISEMKQMKITEACQYLKTEYHFNGANYVYEDVSWYQGSPEEVNGYIRENLEKHPFSLSLIHIYVVFRLGFARTRKEARQIVDHKFVTVNGKQVNIPSYLVKAGDVIEIKEKNKNIQRMKDIVEVTGGRLVPDWLEVDTEKLQGTVKELPSREQIDVPVDEMLIVELYSK